MKKLSIFCFGFVITIIVCAGVIPIHAQSPWFINEDFSSNNNYWLLEDDSALTTRLSDDGYHIRVNDKTPYIIAKKYALDQQHDFKIEATFKLLSTEMDFAFGLFFGGGEGMKQGYEFLIAGNGVYIIRQSTLGGLTNIDGPADSKGLVRKGYGETNKLSLIKREGYWDFYINDVRITGSKTYPFAGERFGFFVSDKIQVAVSSFKVYDWTLAEGLPQYEKEPLVFTKLHDNFYDNKNEWLDKSNSSADILINNHYTLENKTDRSYTMWNFADMALSTDCLIEIEVEHEKGVNNWGYGLAFGLLDVDNKFIFMIADGGFKISKTEKGTWTTLVDWTDTSVIIKGEFRPNHLELRRIGNEWKFYVNHHLLATLKAQPFFGKNYGLYVEDKQRIRMNYIKVASLYFPK